jgi:hypothetical protein
MDPCPCSMDPSFRHSPPPCCRFPACPSANRGPTRPHGNAALGYRNFNFGSMKTRCPHDSVYSHHAPLAPQIRSIADNKPNLDGRKAPLVAIANNLDGTKSTSFAIDTNLYGVKGFTFAIDNFIDRGLRWLPISSRGKGGSGKSH